MRTYFALVAAIAALSPTMGVRADDLWTRFSSPPPAARPLVYWHWVDGNVTRDGIRKDFEWLRDIGVGGVALFDVKLAGEKRIATPQTYMSPLWKSHFTYATQLAHDFHLSFSVAATHGWSMTGGASVPLRDGMKKLVWSQVDVKGDTTYDARLPSLPDVAGPFQSQPMRYSVVFRTIGTAKRLAAYSEDYKVLAFPIDQSDRFAVSVKDQAGRPIEASKLGGDDLSSGVTAQLDDATQDGHLDLDYGDALSASAATVFIPDHPIPFHAPAQRADVQFATDDGTFVTVATFAPSALPITKAFPPVTARYWRLRFYMDDSVKDGPGFEHPDGANAATFIDPEIKPGQIEVRQVLLHTVPRIDQFQMKAGFASAPSIPVTDDGQATGIAPDHVIDLTDHVHNGRLTWQVPAGRWRILRLGFSSNGSTNEPAEDLATGPEVDKFDAVATRTYIKTYLKDRLALSRQTSSDHRLASLFVDSIEAKPANWSPIIPGAFRQSFGYDIDPWLPALAGYVVKDRAASDAFLSSYRYLLGTLSEVNHYKVLADEAKGLGLSVFGEAHENGRPFFGDDITLRKYADVPMGAMWAYRGFAPQPVSEMDLRGATSVASIYGKANVGAESLTSAFSYWAYGPQDLKTMLDTEYALGVTLPVIHSTVHQPKDDGGPGIPLWIFGQYFNRLDAWSAYAKPFVSYMSRMDALLSQGTRPSSILFLYGDDIPLVAQYQKALPKDAPNAHTYDFVSGRALVEDFTITKGALTSPSGRRYDILIVGSKTGPLRPAVTDKLKTFSNLGGHILGLTTTPADGAAAAKGLGQADQGLKGLVEEGANVDDFIDRLGKQRDVTGLPDNGRVIYVRRTHQSQEVYFIKNLDAHAFNGPLSFPFTARCAQLWDPVSVTRQALPVATQNGTTTLNPVSLSLGQSVLLVFDKAARAPCAAARSTRVVKRIEGWRRHIDGAKDTLSPSPTDLSASPDPKDQHYVGKISYSTRFYAKTAPRMGASLAFTKVGVAGEVRCNGKKLGVIWAAPYQVPLGRCLKRGWNAIRVDVASLWVNGLIDGAQTAPRAAIKPYYQSTTKPVLSGLSGPVFLITDAR